MKYIFSKFSLNRFIKKEFVANNLFKVTAEKMIDNTLYFIARKISTVSTEEEPSYSPIVKLKRVGLDGDIIMVYKFRTMHPYSRHVLPEDVQKIHLLVLSCLP